MFEIDDRHFDRQYLERCFGDFDRHPILARCEGLRIAVRVADVALWIALCLYLKERGGTVLPLAVDTPPLAAKRRAERSGCQYLLFDARGDAALQSLEPLTEHGRSGPESEPVHCAPGLIQMSSGTTGEPKFIARSWSSIDTEVSAYIRRFGASMDTTPVVACPVHHSYGLISGVLVALARRACPIVVTNPNPKYVLRRLSGLSRPLLYSSPTLIATSVMLAGEGQPIFGIMTSGTTMQKAWFDLVRMRTHHVHQQYGCSEVGCITLGEDIAEANELGAALPHLEVIAGRSASEPAEILVKVGGSPVVETRDLGYVTDGRLHFVARLDDMINVSGLKVYPGEVEEVVLEMSGVSDAVVYRAHHDFGTDQVCLDFVSAGDVSSEQMREWCGQKLAPYQVPMNIRRVASIPRQSSGKVSRRALAEEARSPRRDESLLEGPAGEASK